MKHKNAKFGAGVRLFDKRLVYKHSNNIRYAIFYCFNVLLFITLLPVALPFSISRRARFQ